MSWGFVAVAGATVVGAAIGADANRSAANKQGDAEQRRIDEQKRQYDLYREDQKPYREAGYSSLAELSRLLGLSGDPRSAGYGSLNSQFTGKDLAKDPGYQFRLQQGQSALENSAAARGGLFSGATGKALTSYGQGFASDEFNNAWNRDHISKNDIFNRYSGLAGTGQIATQQVGQAGRHYADQYGDAVTSAANAQAAAGIANGNIWGNAFNSIGSMFGGGMGGMGGGQFTSPNIFGNYSNPIGDGVGIDPGGFLGGFGSAGDYSDPALKMNVQRIATRPDGLGLYSFQYVWGGPYRVGLMADEVEIAYPHAITRDPVGFRKVDYSQVPQWQPI